MLVTIRFSTLLRQSLEGIGLPAARFGLVLVSEVLVLHLVEYRDFRAAETIRQGTDRVCLRVYWLNIVLLRRERASLELLYPVIRTLKRQICQLVCILPDQGLLLFVLVLTLSLQLRIWIRVGPLDDDLRLL